MRIVLDTNVFISGLLSPDGPPAQILRLLAAGKLTLCFDIRIIEEYRTVAARPRFKIDYALSNLVIDELEQQGINVVGHPLSSMLPDPGDQKFLEAAVAGDAEFLVTGNLKHFPPTKRIGVRVVSPRQLIEHLRTR